MKEILAFLLHGEGLKLKAYQCPAKKWTIAIGNTFYADGRAVKEGDTITLQEAQTLALVVATGFANHVKSEVKATLTNNQFIALVSFCYNIGEGRFTSSKMLKMVNANPNNPAIKPLFLISFITAGGVFSKGLVNRRQSEANKYFQ